MRTDDLIQTLAADSIVERPRMLLWLLGGLAVTAALVFGVWGMRDGYASAMSAPDVAAKQVVPFIAALLLIWPLSRIGRVEKAPLWPLALPVAAFAALFLRAAPEGGFLGHSAAFCLMSVLLLSLPIGGALFAALSRMTVFSPERGGLVAGLMAGTLAATCYAFFCDEDSASFYAIWYSLGIVLSGFAGRWAGKRYLGV